MVEGDSPDYKRLFLGRCDSFLAGSEAELTVGGLRVSS
jgi:hypothetical protein